MRLTQRLHHLCPLLALTVSALPQLFDAAGLPGRLQSALPQCAQSCVSDSASAAWPASVCSSTEDLGCLCRSKSVSGYTLGEIGIQCLASSCSSDINMDTARQRDVYFVCSDQEGALPHTHSILTVTALTTPPSDSSPRVNANIVAASTRGAQPTSTSTLLSTSEASQTSTASQTDFASSSTTTSFIPDSRPSQSRSQALPSQPARLSPPEPPKSLTTGQIIGIAVSGSITVLVLGIVTLLCCLKRRKRQAGMRGETSGFRMLRSPRPGQLENGGEDPWKGAAPAPSAARPPHTARPAHLRPALRVVTSNTAPKSAPIGLAMTPDSAELQPVRHGASLDQIREHSALLPDKPVFKPTTPAPVHHRQSNYRQSSHATVFEDDGSSDYNGSITTATSRRTSLDFATAYYSRTDEHLRGHPYPRELVGSPPDMHPDFVNGQYTPRLTPPIITASTATQDDDNDPVSPISPERLKYPAIPRSLSTAVGLRRQSSVRPLRPTPPPRNDTYARNEDLVIATTQALTRVTGSSAWTEQKVKADPDRDLEHMHLKDEVERARRGLNLMRERDAMAAAATTATNGAKPSVPRKAPGRMHSAARPRSGTGGVRRAPSSMTRRNQPLPTPIPNPSPAGLGLFPRVPSADVQKKMNMPLPRTPAPVNKDGKLRAVAE